MIYIDISFILIAIIKLLLISGLSFLVGIEREFHSHPGGVTTHILVGIGSCIFTMISVDYNKRYNTIGDPMRVSAQIVSGIGFLGSATVYKSNDYVKGINTAASIWISAANGMAVGSDMIEFGLISTIFTMILLIGNNYYKKYAYRLKKIKEKLKNKIENDIEESYKDDEDEEIYIEDGDETIDNEI